MDGNAKPPQVLPVAIFVDAPNILLSIRDGLSIADHDKTDIVDVNWLNLFDHIIRTLRKERKCEPEVVHAGVYCPNYVIADVLTKRNVLEAEEAEFTLIVEQAKDVDRLIVDDIWYTVTNHRTVYSGDIKLEVIIVSGDGDFARTAERVLATFEGVAFRVFGLRVNSI
ncbi:hypothetical protein COU17_00405 [Candidatus Kaiserbacteria bacterium CG10_big_fil_rev_8_21_14_0_10_49_17]|uniref:NYN domain-containing protein n=1 Tax=Candidatus Kaiserbacteria bacterium CG10_big_fil_rev_8_21_14_0_10_49_17 TaxID=1974609 RepID=A0A2M6WF98_9BACT|nr:MAG: hypothetical protein COU17_00405 [Candidatus Kaiserbacteria bacterium CG10_big_fil_rev_8_21_14_0_10_49_17]